MIQTYLEIVIRFGDTDPVTLPYGDPADQPEAFIREVRHFLETEAL